MSNPFFWNYSILNSMSFLLYIISFYKTEWVKYTSLYCRLWKYVYTQLVGPHKVGMSIKTVLACRDATWNIQNFLNSKIFNSIWPSFYTKNGDKFPEIHLKFLQFMKFPEKWHVWLRGFWSQSRALELDLALDLKPSS